MTMQRSDVFIFNNNLYYVIQIKNGSDLFDPCSLGYKLFPTSTACFSGYAVIYKLDNNKNLIIEELVLSTESEETHPVNGVEPIKLDSINENNSTKELYEKKLKYDYCGNLLFKNINMPICYTGIVIISTYEIYWFYEFSFYGNIGEDEAESEDTLELEFINGKLINYKKIKFERC